MPGGRPKLDPVKRLLSYAKESPSGCVEWQGALNRGGYGKFQLDGRTQVSHRVAYQLLKGEIPEGQWVLHRCDNRRCINPEHLFLGHSQENVEDMDAKGRRGTKCQFSEREVQAILGLLDQGVSQQKIADAWGVHQTLISRLKLRKTTLFRKE